MRASDKWDPTRPWQRRPDPGRSITLLQASSRLRMSVLDVMRLVQAGQIRQTLDGEGYPPDYPARPIITVSSVDVEELAQERDAERDGGG